MDYIYQESTWDCETGSFLCVQLALMVSMLEILDRKEQVGGKLGTQNRPVVVASLKHRRRITVRLAGYTHHYTQAAYLEPGRRLYAEERGTRTSSPLVWSVQLRINKADDQCRSEGWLNLFFIVKTRIVS